MLATIAYTQTYSAAQTDVDFPVLSDPSFTTLNNHAIFPIPTWLQWAYANALLLQRVRISTPRLRPISRPLIRPIEQAAAPSSRPQFMEWFRHPIMLNALEEIQILYTTTTAAAERGFVILTVGDNNRNIPQGDMYTIRGTTSYTTTANAWSSGVITLDDTLAPGRYSVIGMDVFQATLEAARLIFPAGSIQGGWAAARPGVLGNVIGGQGTRYMRYGILGELGQFNSYALPQIDALNSAAVANPEVYLDIVQVSQGYVPGVASH
jgi:hypothetical protein